MRDSAGFFLPPGVGLGTGMRAAQLYCLVAGKAVGANRRQNRAGATETPRQLVEQMPRKPGAPGQSRQLARPLRCRRESDQNDSSESTPRLAAGPPGGRTSGSATSPVTNG